MFANLVFLSEKFGATAEAALGTPFAVLIRCTEFTPSFAIPTLKAFQCTASSESIIAGGAFSRRFRG